MFLRFCVAKNMTVVRRNAVWYGRKEKESVLYHTLQVPVRCTQKLPLLLLLLLRAG